MKRSKKLTKTENFLLFFCKKVILFVWLYRDLVVSLHPQTEDNIGPLIGDSLRGLYETVENIRFLPLFLFCAYYIILRDIHNTKP